MVHLQDNIVPFSNAGIEYNIWTFNQQIFKQFANGLSSSKKILLVSTALLTKKKKKGLHKFNLGCGDSWKFIWTFLC